MKRKTQKQIYKIWQRNTKHLFIATNRQIVSFINWKISLVNIAYEYYVRNLMTTQGKLLLKDNLLFKEQLYINTYDGKSLKFKDDIIYFDLFTHLINLRISAILKIEKEYISHILADIYK